MVFLFEFFLYFLDMSEKSGGSFYGFSNRLLSGMFKLKKEPQNSLENEEDNYE